MIQITAVANHSQAAQKKSPPGEKKSVHHHREAGTETAYNLENIFKFYQDFSNSEKPNLRALCAKYHIPYGEKDSPYADFYDWITGDDRPSMVTKGSESNFTFIRVNAVNSGTRYYIFYRTRNDAAESAYLGFHLIENKHIDDKERFAQIGAQNFLVVRAENDGGSGLSDRREDWLPLAKTGEVGEIEPVLAASLEGFAAPAPGVPFSFEYYTTGINNETLPDGRIAIIYNYVFKYRAENAENVEIGGEDFSKEPEQHLLFKENKQACYVKSSDGTFKLEKSRSQITESDLDLEHATENLVENKFAQLKELAINGDPHHKSLLKKSLAESPKSKEKTELLRLLAGNSASQPKK